MNDPGRPPLLDVLTHEAIDRLLYQVDAEHWPNIIAFRVNKYYPPDIPIRAPAPQHLMIAIRWYASMLFKAEADQYDRLRKDKNYPAWLSRLTDRVISRVLKNLDQLDAGDPDALLLNYHGLKKADIEQALCAFFPEIERQYRDGTTPWQIAAAKSSPQQGPARTTAAVHTDTGNERETIATQRKAVVEPILETKGWSVLDWATQSDVAYHTAADYLAGKTHPYRSSRAKMAKSLGLSVQQLPR